jgi:hypothetical protein
MSFVSEWNAFTAHNTSSFSPAPPHERMQDTGTTMSHLSPSVAHSPSLTNGTDDEIEEFNAHECLDAIDTMSSLETLRHRNGTASSNDEVYDALFTVDLKNTSTALTVYNPYGDGIIPFDDGQENSDGNRNDESVPTDLDETHRKIQRIFDTIDTNAQKVWGVVNGWFGKR